MGVATRNRDFMACPRCDSEDSYRSRGRGIYERIVLRVFDRYPCRCKQCGARFYYETPETRLGLEPRLSPLVGQEPKGLSIRIQPKETFFLLNQSHSSPLRQKEP